ncbi:hypothetical protein E3P99_04105 [Wallemia hederae]|uniref:Protein kinase domain-containing protein n=1 Tax=Wallemia hederae TaxID=1540922 RepID=A0A4T0FAC7_9BASI|nr:hypothetical protein E3P99_04105 [Wallemia hederae]
MSNFPQHVQQAQSLLQSTLDDGRIKLKFISTIGTGAYGTVLLAERLDDYYRPLNELYAVKCLPKFGLDDRQKAFQRREIALHGLACSHQHIATVHAIIDSPATIFVVLEYASDGDLFSMITERFKYLDHDQLIKKVFLQIIDAVQHCHRLGIYHRDLKPENILCTDDGNSVLLADFGLATSERRSGDFGCGSSFYMSPDCHGALTHRKVPYCTKRNDIWSLGVILVNLTCGRNPWKEASLTDETFSAYLREPDFLKTILPISDLTNNILKRIFTIDPIQRCSLDELKQRILQVEKFTLTPAQLKHAHKAARQAAAATSSAAASALAVRNIQIPKQVDHEQVIVAPSPPPPIAKETGSPKRVRVRQRVHKNDKLPLTPPTTPPKESNLQHLRRVERKPNLKKTAVPVESSDSSGNSNDTDSSFTSKQPESLLTPLSTPPESPSDAHIKFSGGTPKSSTFSKLTQMFKPSRFNSNSPSPQAQQAMNIDIDSDFGDHNERQIERVSYPSALAIDIYGMSK